jgi:hypothetical protein
MNTFRKIFDIDMKTSTIGPLQPAGTTVALSPQFALRLLASLNARFKRLSLDPALY